MNQAWSIDWRNRKPGADLSDISSPGLLAELQIAIAQILDENKVFGGDRVAIVLQAPGDYLAEMRKRLATVPSSSGLMTPQETRRFGLSHTTALEPSAELVTWAASITATGTRCALPSSGGKTRCDAQ